MVYFDNAATTPLDSRVLEAMRPYLLDSFGNPSSLHSPGREAQEALTHARQTLADTLGAQPDEIVFTGSGTEANNLAIKGIAFARKDRGNHLVVSSIEHDCILNTCRWLETQGFHVSYLPVDSAGLVEVEQVQRSITPKTLLVSVMHANNEVGTIQPIDEIGRLCRERGIPFHTDACQSFGKIPLDVNRDRLDLCTINAHKIHGPKGVGALYIRRGIHLTPLLHGGGQERGIRSSTENVAAIVGFARAGSICRQQCDDDHRRIEPMRDWIIDTLLDRFPIAYLNGHRTQRLPGHVSLSFQGMEGEAIRLLLELDKVGIAVSSGSACSSNDAENKPSHVLLALGRNPVEARGALRITLGRFNTDAEVTRFLDIFNAIMSSVRSISSISLI